MRWVVETLNPSVDAELEALPAGLRARIARIARIAELIEAVGLERVGEPHVKQLEGKLWEMRAMGPDSVARAICMTVTGRRVVILHAFVKKSQKTPRQALDTARQRAKELNR
ncbi:MAG: type II toxin-antitoxin system RelE/ParE family toxin [Gammaproteobacteria bacterium]|nr:type II toxin-antitoxin system RelE/ParE family toxin [Gammaproteobacteria bacterium]